MEIIDKIVYTLLGFFASLAVLFWRGYVGKKAENAALIEDTGQITKIQEAVKRKFSLADEERKAIYDVSRTTTELVCFYSFLAMIPDNHKEENQMLQELVDNSTATAVAWEKLATLRLEFIKHTPLLKATTDQFEDMFQIVQDDS